MYDFEEVRTTRASLEQLWAVYADVTGWPRWHGGFDAAVLDGPFASGTAGYVTVRVIATQDVPFHLENVVPRKGFDVVWGVGPLMSTRMTHTLEEVEGGTRFKHAYHTGGIMAPFAFLQAASAHSRTRSSMDLLAKLAEGA
jgi:hypothetical protein